jgi:hypothetical protein
MKQPATEIPSFEQALAELGVAPSTLAPAERTALDRDGFVVLRDVLVAAQLSRLRDLFERDAAAGRPGSPNTMREEKGTRHLTRLLDVADGAADFRGAAFHPRVLAAVMHVLRRPFRIGALGGREPLQGFGQQGLHADWYAPASKGVHAVATALWLLDDYTADNGATRLVPGSHRRTDAIDKSLAQPQAHHAREVVVRASAGSVLVFNGHSYHSGTRNVSGERRRVLHAVFIAAELPHHDEKPIDCASFSSAQLRLLPTKDGAAER